MLINGVPTDSRCRILHRLNAIVVGNGTRLSAGRAGKGESTGARVTRMLEEVVQITRGGIRAIPGRKT